MRSWRAALCSAPEPQEVYARHMADPPPARSAPANVALPRGLLISIDAIAVIPAGR
jgi:2-iminobutanoate/2-iminopropanoate deaminase